MFVMFVMSSFVLDMSFAFIFMAVVTTGCLFRCAVPGLYRLRGLVGKGIAGRQRQ